MSMFPDYEDEPGPGKHAKPEVEPEVEYTGLEEPANADIASQPVVKEKLGIPYKAIIAFLGVLGGIIWTRATETGTPVIPDTFAGWSALLGGSLVAAVTVYLKGNVYTVKQAKQNLGTAVNHAT